MAQQYRGTTNANLLVFLGRIYPYFEGGGVKGLMATGKHWVLHSVGIFTGFCMCVTMV